MSLFEPRIALPDEELCWQILHHARWDRGVVVCPGCKGVGESAMWLAQPHYWQCRYCRKRFCAKNGTILHRSHLDLPVWFRAIQLIEQNPGISSVALARELGIQQKTAWSLAGRLRQMAAQDKILYGKIAKAMKAGSRSERHSVCDASAR